MTTASRVRIRIMQRDGTCPSDGEACLETIGDLPFPRGVNVLVSIVNDDGSETRLRNVKRLAIVSNGRGEAVTALLEVFSPVLDMVLPAEMVESADPGDDGFLGEIRS